MDPKCIATVTKAAGRALTKAEIASIDDRISGSMRSLARRDPLAWREMTTEQRITAGATAAMQDIRDQAARKLGNAERQILRQVETAERVRLLQESFAGTPGHSGTVAEALKRDFELTGVKVTAERKIAQADLVSLIEAAGDKRGVGFGRKVLMAVFDAENPLMTRDIIKEIYQSASGKTGNQRAAMAARAWLDTIEALRVRFNAAGGDVGRLDYGYVPQPHDTARVRKAGAQAWAESTMPLLDRSRYIHDDGTRLSDDELRQTLHSAWETLATEGLNKQELGAYKSAGARANRGDESRQIHFADGDAWSSYMRQFGRGSIYDAMMKHIGGITRDISLTERYGPNSEATARLMFDSAALADGTRPNKLVGALSISPQTYWDMISGKVGTPVDETLARNLNMVRSLQVAAKLGGAVISSITDVGTLLMNTGYNRLPYWQLLKDVGANTIPDWAASLGIKTGKEMHEWMSAHGMIAESAANEINRWSGDNLGANWSGKLANSVLKLSLLNAWTDGLRQGFTLSMNAGLARMAKQQWGDLAEFDRSRLTRAGFTDADWGILNSIEPTTFKGRELMTPQSIKQSGHEQANALAAKVFGFIHDESEFAVLNPDMATRAVTTFGGTQAGTWSGEIARTVMQFKSFPIAMFTRHWARMLDGDHDAQGAPMLANRTAYGFALMATMTGLGAVATQEKQILQGKDPIDMEKPRFWLKALAQGGGFSIAGDLFLVDPSSSSTDAATTAVKNIAGPTIGTGAELLFKDLSENIWQASEGKDTHWEAELLATAKAQTPAANLWYIKPLVEHGITNALNESLSPGYLAKAQQRGQKEYGQRYWWAPRDTLPQRAPDLAKAVGQ